MNNLLDANTDVTSCLFGIDWADALRLTELRHHKEALQLQEVCFGECGYERASDWMRMVNKLNGYDNTTLVRMFAGDSKKGYDHGDFTIQCIDRNYGTVLVTFKEPQLFVVGQVGDNYIPAYVSQFSAKFDWNWYHTRGNKLEVADILDIYLIDIKFIA